MPFGRVSRLVPLNTVLDRGPGLPVKREICRVGAPVRIDAVYRQIFVILNITHLNICCLKGRKTTMETGA